MGKPNYNILVIMLDSLRKDHVGYYGNNWIKTPAIDQLAKESVLFTNAYPESLPTLPVRRAMHTGMRTFPNRNYVPRKGDTVMIPGWEPIPENQYTMAEILQKELYLTAMYTDTYHMFKPSMNFHRGFYCWEWIRGQESDRYRLPLKGDVENLENLPCELAYGCVGPNLNRGLANMQGWKSEEDWFPPRTFVGAMNWLEKNHKKGRFLLVVDEFDPHEPWNAPKNFLDLYFDTASYKDRRIISTLTGPFEFKGQELEYTRAQYAGEVTLVDKYVGKLLNKVKELGLWSDTIIVLVSDHGHPIMEHGIIHKAPNCLYPELMDLVFMIYHPEKEHAGAVCDAYVSHHDILPTLLALNGISSPRPVDGKNIWKWVGGEKTDRREYLTSIFGSWVWCRDDEYVYFSDLDGNSPKLYDLQKDAGQHNDVAEKEPEICRKMYGLILKDSGNLPHYRIDRPEIRWYDLLEAATGQPTGST